MNFFIENYVISMYISMQAIFIYVRRASLIQFSVYSVATSEQKLNLAEEKIQVFLSIYIECIRWVHTDHIPHLLPGGLIIYPVPHINSYILKWRYLTVSFSSLSAVDFASELLSKGNFLKFSSSNRPVYPPCLPPSHNELLVLLSQLNFITGSCALSSAPDCSRNCSVFWHL